ncbi:hypothetical protein [Kingella negevensis]|nr:hypothetical protein [Kingella negevensis]WII90795.1 hypothetical protein QEO93_10365 [Kingella negevensis]
MNLLYQQIVDEKYVFKTQILPDFFHTDKMTQPEKKQPESIFRLLCV